MPVPAITCGVNIAVKVPSRIYLATVAFYRDTLALPVLNTSEHRVAFADGPNRLHIDPVPTRTHAEVWLGLITPDPDAAATRLAHAGVTRCDAVEPISPGFPGFWIASPAGTVRLVARSDT
jgi:hypothetical protein